MNIKRNHIVVLVVLGSLAVVLTGLSMWFGGIRQQSTEKTQKLEVATDPNFPEVKGKLISGFPQFPVYPGATLVASAKTNRVNQPDTGYRAKWETKDAVIKVMRWYQDQLPKSGWKYEVPNDPTAAGEQVAQIKKSGFEGFVEAESEQKGAEIVVEVRITK
ncbi:MAG: hypothetical protein A2Z11_02045 [Candidatus Woykebacteria bacterium RBG_16_43_9]|uniref:Uncharacterized protein n=1 Tax=Candidatus Woykebacteria bacterium RBG_16_43_9 TaxID=1802596 RepID=A0A1G1WE11_9BACT|nr:MAG: hypothetical protein A2Z11_02045 [Candidatus Woykebacteria bacterium RBG_16_43_9]